jgi:hypothetical protein
MAVSQNKAVSAQGLASGNGIAVAAKTTYNDAVGAVRLFVAGINGAVVYGVTAIPRVTITALQAQLYRSRDAGVTLNFLKSKLMSAYTMAGTTEAPQTDFGYAESAPLRLAPNEELWCAIGVAFATGVIFDVQAENL